MPDPRILTLDMSTTNKGHAVWHGTEYIGGNQRNYTGPPFARIDLMIRDTIALCQAQRIDHVIAEHPIYDPKTGADTYAALCYAIGALGVALHRIHVEFSWVWPTEVKTALGALPTANKETMIHAAEVYLGRRVFITGDHHADAIGVFAAYWQKAGAVRYNITPRIQD